ncbi:MAG: tyrosine-protein phosphatase [Actinomycetes bacterium]
MQLEGGLNFREVSKLPTENGSTIAPGRLFRSDTLQFLTQQDVDFLVATIGIRTIIDLRLPYEVETEGFGFPGSSIPDHHHLPFRVDGTDVTNDATPILQAKDPMVPHYLGYLRTMPTSVTQIVRVLGATGGVPAVIHCAAGKDRTGVAVAVVLSAVGVPDDVIAEEYARNADRIPQVMNQLRSMKSYGDSIDRLPPEAHLTDPVYMSRFLAAVQDIYGGVRQYLTDHGVSDDDLQALTQALTESD